MLCLRNDRPYNGKRDRCAHGHAVGGHAPPPCKLTLPILRENDDRELAASFDFSLQALPRLSNHVPMQRESAKVGRKRLRGSGDGDGAAARWPHPPSPADMSVKDLQAQPSRVLFVDFVLALLSAEDYGLARAVLGRKVLAAGVLHGIARDPPDRATIALRRVAQCTVEGSHDGGVRLPTRVLSAIFGDAAVEQLAIVSMRAGREEGGGEAAAASAAKVLLQALATQPLFGITPPRATLCPAGVRAAARCARLLKRLRPTMCRIHARLVIAAADANPCVAAAYLASLSIKVDPSLSERWLTSMALTGKLVTATMRVTDADQSVQADCHSIPTMLHESPAALLDCYENALLPATLGKSLLVRGLQHASSLVRFTTVSLLLRCLRAFDRLLKSNLLVDLEGTQINFLREALRQRLRGRLPDAQTFVAALYASGAFGSAIVSTIRPVLLRSRLLELTSALATAFPDAMADVRLEPAKLLPAHTCTSVLAEAIAAIRLLRTVSGQGTACGSRGRAATQMVALLRSLTTTHCAWLHAEYKALITEALRGAGVCSDNNDESHVWVDLLPCSEAAHWDENQPEAAVIDFLARGVHMAMRRADGDLEGGAAEDSHSLSAELSVLASILTSSCTRFCSDDNKRSPMQQRVAVASYSAGCLGALLHRSHIMLRPRLAAALLERLHIGEPAHDSEAMSCIELLREHCRAATDATSEFGWPSEAFALSVESLAMTVAPTVALSVHFDHFRFRKVKIEEGWTGASGIAALRQWLLSSLQWLAASRASASEVQQRAWQVTCIAFVLAERAVLCDGTAATTLAIDTMSADAFAVALQAIRSNTAVDTATGLASLQLCVSQTFCRLRAAPWACDHRTATEFRAFSGAVTSALRARLFTCDIDIDALAHWCGVLRYADIDALLGLVKDVAGMAPDSALFEGSLQIVVVVFRSWMDNDAEVATACKASLRKAMALLLELAESGMESDSLIECTATCLHIISQLPCAAYDAVTWLVLEECRSPSLVSLCVERLPALAEARLLAALVARSSANRRALRQCSRAAAGDGTICAFLLPALASCVMKKDALALEMYEPFLVALKRASAALGELDDHAIHFLLDSSSLLLEAAVDAASRLCAVSCEVAISVVEVLVAYLANVAAGGSGLLGDAACGRCEFALSLATSLQQTLRSHGESATSTLWKQNITQRCVSVCARLAAKCFVAVGCATGKMAALEKECLTCLRESLESLPFCATNSHNEWTFGALVPFFGGCVRHRLDDSAALDLMGKMLSKLLRKCCTSDVESGCQQLLRLLFSHSRFRELIAARSDSHEDKQSHALNRAAASVGASLISILPMVDSLCCNDVDVAHKGSCVAHALLGVVKALVCYREGALCESLGNMQALIEVFAGMYGATLSPADQRLASLLDTLHARCVAAGQPGLAGFRFGWGATPARPCIQSWRCALTVANFPLKYSGRGSTGNVDVSSVECGDYGCAYPALAQHAYDPLYVLQCAVHSLGTRGVDAVREYALNGVFSIALMALAAEDLELRRRGYAVVTLVFALVDGATACTSDRSGAAKQSSGRRCKSRQSHRYFREAPQLEMLLRCVQNAVEVPLMRFPALVAAFAAEAACVLCHPGTPTYSMVSNYLLNRPALDLSALPLFFSGFGSGTHALREERLWTLRLLLVGLRGANDTIVVRRLFVADLLLSFLSSEYAETLARSLAVEVVRRCMAITQCSLDLLDNAGIVPALFMLILQPLGEVDYSCGGARHQDQRIACLAQLALCALLEQREARKRVHRNNSLLLTICGRVFLERLDGGDHAERMRFLQAVLNAFGRADGDSLRWALTPRELRALFHGPASLPAVVRVALRSSPELLWGAGKGPEAVEFVQLATDACTLVPCLVIPFLRWLAASFWIRRRCSAGVRLDVSTAIEVAALTMRLAEMFSGDTSHEVALVLLGALRPCDSPTLKLLDALPPLPCASTYFEWDPGAAEEGCAALIGVPADKQSIAALCKRLIEVAKEKAFKPDTDVVRSKQLSLPRRVAG